MNITGVCLSTPDTRKMSDNETSFKNSFVYCIDKLDILIIMLIHKNIIWI